MCIRKRFNAHCNLIINNKLINKLYLDISELGFNNFEYAIIGIIKNLETLSKEAIKEKLDKYEKYYINEYNSYKEGYNLTIGGDGGILGYKMSEELRKIISHNSKEIANDGRNTIYVYDLLEKKEYIFTSYTQAIEILGVKRDSLYSAERRKGICLLRYIPRKNKEEIYDFIDKLNNKEIINNKGLFLKKLSKEKFKETIELYPNKTVEELCKILGICKKTFYNYKNEI